MIPCNGFGDIVFATKISNYLKEWYNAKVHILTTRPEDFLKIGKTHDVYKLLYKKTDECRYYKGTEMPKEIINNIYDLIFIAPLQIDLKINKNDIKSIIPYSNQWNTYFFSEYNDSLHKDFDFHTGVGSKRLGLLFTDLKVEPVPLKTIKNPYVVVYVAESIKRVSYCYISFFVMISKKYSKTYKNLDVIVPHFVTNELEYMKDFASLEYIKKEYPNIVIKQKDTPPVYLCGSTNSQKNTITFRGDIYPITNKDMMSLFIFSLEDVLVTGDQSITDVLSCCYKKNIWYQQADWKMNFAHNLEKFLPQEYFANKKTTCGTLEAISYKSNYDEFYHTWDFRKLGKELLDKVVSFTILKPQIQDILEIISKSRTITSVKNKIENIL
jgi:hypothetical protein